MAYRALATTNTGTSPYKVMLGRPMRLAIDWSLSAPEPTTPSAVQYAKKIGPKLEVLHQIAMTNAGDSAARHRQARNEEAKPLPYAAGDKVLLRDTRIRKGETAKLKRPYTGPFIITECRPGFDYRLQELQTGRDLKRAVHADRLRPQKELQNDYRQPAVNRVVASGKLQSTRVSWLITINYGEPNDLGASVRLTAPEPTDAETNSGVVRHVPQPVKKRIRRLGSSFTPTFCGRPEPRAYSASGSNSRGQPSVTMQQPEQLRMLYAIWEK
jgi:hypothetical protein